MEGIALASCAEFMRSVPAVGTSMTGEGWKERDPGGLPRPCMERGRSEEPDRQNGYRTRMLVSLPLRPCDPIWTSARSKSLLPNRFYWVRRQDSSCPGGRQITGFRAHPISG